MVADVSCLMRFLSRYDKEDGGEGNHRGELVTRDLLGGASVAPAAGTKMGLDLGLQSPAGWEEKRLDLASGKAHGQQGGGGGSGRPVQDLNMPPLCSSGFPPLPRPAALQLSKIPPEGSGPALDLRLRSPAPPPAGYQSVCTLEKVKSALERAQRESQRKPPAGSSSPASSSTTSSSAKRRRDAARDDEGEGESRSSSSSSVVVQGEGCVGGSEAGGAGSAMAAAGCPSCLLYVLISRVDPRCPRCNTAVPLPAPPGKKPRIDLNAAIGAPAVTAPSANNLRTVFFF